MPTSTIPTIPTMRQVKVQELANMFALFFVLAGTSVFLTFDTAGNQRSINGENGFFPADIQVSEVSTFGASLGVGEQLLLSVVARYNQFNELSFKTRAAKVQSLVSAFFMFAFADQFLQRAAPEMNRYPKGEIAAFIGSATLATVNNMIDKTLTSRTFGLGTLTAFAAFGTFVAVNSAMSDYGQPVEALSAAGAGVIAQAVAIRVIEKSRDEPEQVRFDSPSRPNSPSFVIDEEAGNHEEAGEKQQAGLNEGASEVSDTGQYARLQGDDEGASPRCAIM